MRRPLANGPPGPGARGQLPCRPSAATGALLWTRPGGNPWGSPTVTGGSVYAVGTENGTWKLFARRADTGALRWKRALPGEYAGTWLAVAGGRVLATTGTGISAFDAATGAPRWRVAAAGASSPAVANGLAYAGLSRGIGAWRLSDGAQRWRFGTIAYGDPVVSGGRLYVTGVAGLDGGLVAVVDPFALRAAVPGVIR